MKRRAGTVALAALAAALLSGPVGAEEILVSAAASLTHAFPEIGAAFERANPGVKVSFNFGASGSLLRQLEQGAPVSVFASADQETMDLAQARGLVDRSSRRDFATNRLVLAVPTGAKAPVRALADLSEPAVTRIALANPDFAPAGRYARQVLEDARLWHALQPKLVLGNTVPQVLDYLDRGEVDAGFVFLTDVAAARGKVSKAVEVTPRSPIVYPIAAVSGRHESGVASRFVGFVCNEEGRATLGRHGFGAPPGGEGQARP